MTQPGLQLDEEKLCCSICLDILKVPVTIPCGHSYCMSCIKDHWNEEDPRSIYSCPQCRKTFVPRPVLGKNTMLSDLVEEMKKIGLQVAPQRYAQLGEVGCDFCTGRKLKAVKSCLQCLASYCELHLQPHYDSPTFQKHKLVEASANIQENICSRHNKVKEIFCRSDQQSICYLCSVEDHKGHDTVSTAAERTERQKGLGPSQQNIQQRIQDLEKDELLLQQEVDDINTAADRAAKDSQAMFTQLLQFMEKQSSEVQQQIRSQQETEVTRAKQLQKKVQREITELRRKDTELEQLLHTEDHNQFLLRFPPLASLSPSSDRVGINISPRRYFKELTSAVSEVTQHLQDNLRQQWTKVTLSKVDVLLAQAEPEILPPPKAILSRAKYINVLKPAPSAQQQYETLPIPQTPADFKNSPSPVCYQTAQEFKTPSSPTTSLTPQDCKTSPSLTVYPTSPVSKTSPPPVVYETLKEFETSPSAAVCPRSPVSETLPSPAIYQEPPLPSLYQEPPLPSLYQEPLDDTQSRANFLAYSCQITLDPNTVNKHLMLSEANRKVTRGKRKQLYSIHSDRFADRFQVMSREGLTGCCYWEVQWSGIVSVAATYRNIRRTGNISGFGDNDKSWALYCHNNKFIHRSMSMVLSGSPSSRVGVYLDHRAGILSFYRVSEPMTLLHRVQTTFTQPLHVGLCVVSGSAELVQLL